MARVAAEERQVRELLDRVEELEDIAASMPERPSYPADLCRTRNLEGRRSGSTSRRREPAGDQ